MTDQELVELFLARSEEAVPALQDQYGPYCRAVASGVLSDPRDVDECLNDCWWSATGPWPWGGRTAAARPRWMKPP